MLTLTCQDLCALLKSFQDRTVTIRERRVNQQAIFVRLDSDGSGMLDAKLEQPGHGTEDAVLGAVLAEMRDRPSEIFASFRTLEELEDWLRGSSEPCWRYADE